VRRTISILLSLDIDVEGKKTLERQQDFTLGLPEVYGFQIVSTPLTYIESVETCGIIDEIG